MPFASHSIAQRDGIVDHGHIGSPRLLRRLARDAPPTLHPRLRGLDQMLLAALRNHGGKTLHA